MQEIDDDDPTAIEMGEDSAGQDRTQINSETTEGTRGSSFSSINTRNIRPSTKSRPKATASKQNELLTLACHYLKTDDKGNKFDNIAKVWADKLKELEPNQRMYAEKAINDIFFGASLNGLHKNSVKINETVQVPIRNDLSYRSYTPPSNASGNSNYTTGVVSPPEINHDNNSSVSSYFSHFTDM